MGLFRFLKNILRKDKSTLKVAQDTPVSNVETQHADEDDRVSIYLQPLSNGLLPGEVVLLDWLEGRYIHSTFPTYFSQDYSLDIEQSVNKLFEEAFITEAGPVESLQSFKVTELKEILRENDLKVSGRKDELIKRLINHLTEAEISGYVHEKPVKITSKGQEALEDYYYIVPAHKNGSTDGVYNVASALKYVSQLDYQPTNSEIFWALLQDALSQYYKDAHFASYRLIYQQMARQHEQNNSLQDALLNYLNAFILKFSGLGNHGVLEKPGFVFMSPGITKKIEDISGKLEYDDESLQDLFDQAWHHIAPGLPFHYLDQETCYQCLLADLNDNKDFIKEKVQRSYDVIDRETFEESYGLRLPAEESDGDT